MRERKGELADLDNQRLKEEKKNKTSKRSELD